MYEPTKTKKGVDFFLPQTHSLEQYQQYLYDLVFYSEFIILQQIQLEIFQIINTNKMQIDDKLNQILTFVSISNLMKQSFYIPGYQRNYRWQPEQVIALLDDIWVFREKTIKAKTNRFGQILSVALVIARRQQRAGKLGFFISACY